MAKRLRILSRKPSETFSVRASGDDMAWAMVDLLVVQSLLAGIPAANIVVRLRRPA